ncbi:uncharacterized protein BXIN_0505 [Babesia sp. Xinjiang]|uniref:uncharacterized protein n=1 Tax=Babesia sp. Xinjiang TaxID=462227 RepID=UPI000A261641|nr:uncharacterized protein BXIN_0505 [Babesia sp. Xinjiang]ORM41880.1 hypothetical protein BXIN_0505 [Babesia sp. Xinjiang]
MAVICSWHIHGEGTDQLDELPEGRTLFLKSLDPCLAHENLARGLSRFGEVEVTALTKTSRNERKRSEGPGLYHAVFQSAEAARQVIAPQNDASDIVIPLKSHKPKTHGTVLSAALERHRSQYRGMDILQKNADECLVAYDIAEDLDRRLEQEVIVDDEGFTLVTHGPEAVKAGVARRGKKRTRHANVTTVDFYRFPNKEKVLKTETISLEQNRK